MIPTTPTPVSSSNISTVHHTGDALIVVFRDGSTYRYSGVTETEAEDMVYASSPGSYFHRNIKDSYVGERIG